MTAIFFVAWMYENILAVHYMSFAIGCPILWTGETRSGSVGCSTGWRVSACGVY